MYIFLLFSLLLISTLGCGGSGGSDHTPSDLPLTFIQETVVRDAAFPVSLQQASDGRLFYTELASGSIRVVSQGFLLPTPFARLEVPATGNEGLLGLALDPQFERNGYIYSYYTARNPLRNRVVRFTAIGDQGNEPVVLIDNLPYGGHDGGRLVFGQDETLFISVGDAGRPELAQDQNSYAGKILRIQRDGSIPTDNPFPNSPIFALGLRNAFGLSIDPRNGVLYASDNGPTCDDELNRVDAGSNLGWRAGQPCGDGDRSYSLPILTFNPSTAPTGISFYEGNVFPSLRNELLVADYLRGDLTRFRIDERSGAVIGEETILQGTLGPLIDVSVGKDGYIYVASTDTIVRLVPKA